MASILSRPECGNGLAPSCVRVHDSEVSDILFLNSSDSTHIVTNLLTLNVENYTNYVLQVSYNLHM